MLSNWLLLTTQTVCVHDGYSSRSPCADNAAEISAIAAADVVYDYLALLTMGVDSQDAASKTETSRDEL
jgi:hypothetical protein